MRRLSINRHGLDTLGDIGLAHHEPALRRDADPAALGDPFLFRQHFADFDELLRLQDGVDQRVLGPEMEVLGEPIGGADIREFR